MVVEFSVGNFYSFKDLQTLQLQATSLKSKSPLVDANSIFTIGKSKLLRTKVIYGANASGKSNLIIAVAHMIALLNSLSTNQFYQNTNSKFILDESCEQRPTFFQIIFYTQGVLYRYGFTIDRGKIQNEWLFGTPNKKEVYYFLREGDDIEVNENQYKEGKKMLSLRDEDLLIFNENSFFLTIMAQFKGRISKQIFDYLNSIEIIRADQVFNRNTDRNQWSSIIENLKDPQRKEQITQLLKKADVGIDDVGVISVKSVREGFDENATLQQLEQPIEYPVAYKKRYNDADQSVSYYPMSFETMESAGTNKLLYLSNHLFTTLENGGVLFIDEFDSQLHPNLTKAIVELFNSQEYNPKNAQLVFTTHDSNLLSANLLRRDQICIIEKDEYGASQLTNLSEFKGVRNDSSFEKDYLKGKFGGVPVLNDFERAFSNL